MAEKGKKRNMATRAISEEDYHSESGQTTSALKRARLISQVYFGLMTFGLWLGVGLPAIWGGSLNVALLLVGTFSTYKVFTGVRVTL
jgi:hypothetical protein